MDEDVTAKAPVTRLRRKLSIEQPEESKSPAPSTPTKKRGGKTVKSQLELIEENGPEKTPTKRTTRKSIVRDVVEEEKPLTPSRRSARIRSNTSIISDTPQNYDSPRAKRVMRRNSQVGSDNETPSQATTPARLRRTRKDSVSNIDKPTDSTLITDVISEEPELEPSKLSKAPENQNNISISPNSLRKSTRLKAKQEKRVSGNLDESPNKKTAIKTPQKESKEEANELTKPITPASTKKRQPTDSPSETRKADLSVSSRDLIEESCKQPLKTSNTNNKSLSSLKEAPSIKRTRTKSWTTLAISPTNDNYFLSDNESAKKKVKSKFSINIVDTKSGAGDSILNNTSLIQTKKNSEIILKSSKRKKSQDQSLDTIEIGGAEKSISDSKSKLSSETQKLFETSPEAIIQTKVYIEDSDSNTDAVDKQLTEDQCVPVVTHAFDDQSNSPNSNKIDSTSVISTLISSKNNESCEPMDIDETMPENVVLNDSDDISKNESLNLKDQKRNSVDVVDYATNISKRKSSISNTICEENNLNIKNNEVDTSINLSKRKSLNTSANNKCDETANESLNTSKIKSLKSNLSTEGRNETLDAELNKSQNKSLRKSSITNSLIEDANKSTSQNKSTLVLSQIKENDISLNVTDVEKKHKGLQNIYSTSTPLQDKIATKVINQRAPINVSDIIAKQDKENDTSNSNDTQSSDKDEETSDNDSEDDTKKNKFVVDEAEETSDNYESGDSQDEEERQYERENEIIDKGVTLTSDEDVSNDTDYEKDSFVVSSDEEDNELLDGSGDDLTMSDNELTMTAKSKKKYNERKSKEQKMASREMFEARHKSSKKGLDKRNNSKTGKLDSDDDSIKSPKKTNSFRLNPNSNSMISSDNESVRIKKKKSKRLSESMINSETDESITIKKKQVKRLSESIQEGVDEKEITICNTEVTDKDPLEKIKEEPKTPKQSVICENIENVEIDENVSIIKANQSKDPLQSTIAHEEDDVEDDDSDISSNPEITSDYTNLLYNLNNINKKKKQNDISLNIDRKTKEKKREPIVDELNLTLNKKKKISVSENQVKNEIQNDKEDSSDSIDMKLLFTEDSNDSEDLPKAEQKIPKEGDDFIPLKKSEAKTNIREDGADSYFNKTANNSLNVSSKKQKKANKSIDKSLNVSITTNKNVTGDIKDKSVHNVSANESLNTTSKKDKINTLTIDEANDEPELSIIVSANKSLNTSKKKKKNSISQTNKESDIEPTTEEPVLIIHDTTGNRKQKKNSISKNDITDFEVSLNTSLQKNKKNSLSEDVNKSVNTSIKSSSVKKDDDDDDLPEEIPFTSTKNKSTDNTEVLNMSSTKKEKKQSANIFSTAQEGFKAAASLYDSDESPKTIKSQKQGIAAVVTDTADSRNQNASSEKKKRKRKKKQATKDSSNNDKSVEDKESNEELRKRKLSAMSSVESTKGEDKNLSNVTNNSSVTHKKKKIKLIDNSEPDYHIHLNSKENRKRKKRDEDVEEKASKVIKESSDGNKGVVRLPIDIISKLDDKPDKQVLEQRKATVVSTAEFVVDTAKVRKNKPSQYLEESIYLNQDSPERSKEIRKIKKPKVLPFVPTATTSGCGFTTNFKVSVIPTETKFIAKTTKENFKNDYLQKKLKKFGTYELLKTQRKVKLSKF